MVSGRATAADMRTRLTIATATQRRVIAWIMPAGRQYLLSGLAVHVGSMQRGNVRRGHILHLQSVPTAVVPLLRRYSSRWLRFRRRRWRRRRNKSHMTAEMCHTPDDGGSHMEGQILGMCKGFGSAARLRPWQMAASGNRQGMILSKAGLHDARVSCSKQMLRRAGASPCARS